MVALKARRRVVLVSSRRNCWPITVQTLIDGSWRQRGFGDFYQHMLVAEGCGEIACDPIVAPWDIAPLQIIVEEAGGKATTVAGDRTIYGGSMVSSNGHLHPRALKAFG